MLDAFLRHRREVVTRRTIFDLRKARERAHVLEGLAVALANIDEIIALINAAASPGGSQGWASCARLARRRRCRELLERAGAAVARGRTTWRRNSACRRPAIGSPKCRPRPSWTCACTASRAWSRTRSSGSTSSCWWPSSDLHDILRGPERLTEVMRDELIEMREAYGDARRTEINRDHLDLTTEDLIEPQDVVVTLSHAGYAKSQPVTEYQAQRRGGRGARPPRSRTKTSWRTYSWPTLTTRSCASPIAARSTG